MWEYRIFVAPEEWRRSVERDPSDPEPWRRLVELLNEAGRDGWELVSVASGPEWHAYFKRGSLMPGAEPGPAKVVMMKNPEGSPAADATPDTEASRRFGWDGGPGQPYGS